MHNHDHMILAVASALFAYYMFLFFLFRFFKIVKADQAWEQDMSQVPDLIDTRPRTNLNQPPL